MVHDDVSLYAYRECNVIPVLFLPNRVHLRASSGVEQRFLYQVDDCIFVRCEVIPMRVKENLSFEWGIDNFPDPAPSHVIWFQPSSVSPPNEWRNHPLTSEHEYYWVQLISSETHHTPTTVLCWADKDSAFYAVITKKEQEAMQFSDLDARNIEVLVQARIATIEHDELEDGIGLSMTLVPAGERTGHWIQGIVTHALHK